MKILITGGCGFIGSYLVEELKKRGDEIIILEKDKDNSWRINEEVLIYDLKTPLEKIFDFHDFDAVIHLATYYRKDENSGDIDRMIENNVVFPSLILEQMVRKGIKYFINTGTFFEYSLIGITGPVSEESEKKPYNFYASTKICFESILKYYCEKKDIKAIDLKLFSPYGEKDNEKLILSLINSVLQDKEIEISKGEQLLSWTYVKDVANAYLKALDYLFLMDKNYECFNIGNDNVVSLKEIADIIHEISKKSLIKCVKDYRKDETMFVKCDNSKAKKLLNWFPEYDIKKGLNKTFLYYLNKKERGKRMEFIKTKLEGVYLIENKIMKDERGFFVKTFHDEIFRENGIKFNLKESYYSYSVKNVIRGMHFQKPPMEHHKIVYVVSGKILDVVLDLRKDSPTYGEYASFEISGENGKAVFIPKGFAHGFLSLEDSIVVYMVTSVYSPENDKGILWDSFDMDWNIENPIISERDLNFPKLSEYKGYF